MADLSLGYSIIVDSPARAFGFQRTPPYVRNTDAADMAARGVTLNGLRCVPEANALILQPYPLWQDQLLSDYTFPAITGGSASDWVQGVSTETGRRALLMTNAQPQAGGQPHTWDVLDTDTVPLNAFFALRLSRGQAVAGAASGGAAVGLTGQNDYAVLVVGDPAVPDPYPDAGIGLPFRLVFQRGQPALLQQAASVSGGACVWPDGQAGAVTGSVPDSNSLWENTRVLQVEWLPVPSQNALVVTLGAGADTLVWRADQFASADSSDDGASGVSFGDATPLAVASGALRYYGSGGTAGYEYGDIGFAPVGYALGPTEDLPFVYQGNGYVRVLGDYDPPSVATGIALTDSSGTRVQWQMQMTATADGSGLAPSSPVVTGVQMDIPPTYDYTATVGVPVDISRYVSEIDESCRLEWLAAGDSQTPTIRAQVGLRLDNSFGPFASTGGVQRAVQYSRWLKVRSPASGLFYDYSPPVTLLTGWTGARTSVFKADPRRVFDLVLDDGAYPLADVEVGYCDPLDGWCPLAAVAFLALLQGRDASFIAPYLLSCGFGPNPPGCPHVKLPLGTGQTPKMAFGPNVKYWQAMAEVAAFSHSLLFVDTQNILGMVPYADAVSDAPYKGTFGTCESGDPASGDFLTSLWRSLSVTADMADTRSGVAFFGIDPAVNTVQGTYLDADDFLGAGWTANTIGYRKPLVSVSNLFVDPVFTAYYALAALQRITLPSVMVESGGCFLPGFFPMDAYGITAVNTALTGPIGLILESARQRFSVMEPSVFGGTFTGRMFANAAATS